MSGTPSRSGRARAVGKLEIDGGVELVDAFGRFNVRRADLEACCACASCEQTPTGERQRKQQARPRHLTGKSFMALISQA